MTRYNRFMGWYDPNTEYQRGDVVTFGGAAWYRKTAGKGISPIAVKKPYMVWSRLNDDLSTIFPLGGVGGGNTGGGSASFAQSYTETVPGFVNCYNGEFSTGGNWQRTDYIPVSSGDVVLYSGLSSGNKGVAGYDENKVFVSSVLDRINLEGSFTYENELLTIPDGVAYIVACTGFGPLKVMVYRDAKALVDSVDNKELPADPGAYKQLVTDASGNWVAEDRLAYASEGFKDMVTLGADKLVDKYYAYYSEEKCPFSLAFEKKQVTFNGTSYIVEPIIDNNVGGDVKYAYVWGNYHIASSKKEDTGEPFCIEAWYSANGYWQSINIHIASDVTAESMTIADHGEVVHPLDPKFLPDGTPSINSASVGQTVVVKAVDENGVPTEWEAVDMGNGTPFIIIADGSGGDRAYIESNMSYDILKANYTYLGLRDAVLYYRNADLGYHCTSFEYVERPSSGESYFTITFESAGITVTYDEENKVTISVTGEEEA